MCLIFNGTGLILFLYYTLELMKLILKEEFIIFFSMIYLSGLYEKFFWVQS